MARTSLKQRKAESQALADKWSKDTSKDSVRRIQGQSRRKRGVIIRVAK